jgi:integrase
MKLDTKHRLICLLGFKYGFRPSEILKLKWQDIDLGGRKFLIYRAKNNMPQIFYMDNDVYKAFLEMKAQTGRFEYVFHSHISKEKRMTEFRRWWRNRLCFG